MAKLTVKQRKFADEYIISGNATEAALKAGYSKKTSYSIGNENLKKPDIKNYIEERLKEIEDQAIMKQEEVMKRLTKHARREEIDYQVVLTEKPTYDENGNFSGIEKKPEIVEVITQNKDAIKALELIGKRYALWTDKQEVDADVGLELVIDYGDEDQAED